MERRAPHFVEPMALRLVQELPQGPEWLYEIKWDGYRAEAIKRAGAVALLSRNHTSFSDEYPKVVEAVAMLPAKDLILDGEIVGIGPDGRPSFQALQQRRPQVVYYVFDLLWQDGEDLCGLQLQLRRERLAKLVTGNSIIRFSDELPGDVSTIVSHAAEFGIEGIVAKRRESRYVPGDRSKDWLKFKLDRHQSFVVGGFKGPAANFESLVVGYYDGDQLKFAAKVRAGFNPAGRKQIAPLLRKYAATECPFVDLPQKKRGRFGDGITAEDLSSYTWTKPKIVIEVGFVEWTSAGILRHPKFRTLPADEDPRSVVREQGHKNGVGLGHDQYEP